MTARRSPLISALRAVIPALVFALGLAAASSSQATTVIFTNGTMESPRTVSIAGIGNNIKATPVQFDGKYEIPGPNNDIYFDNLVAFCVDVYHSISLGNYNPDLIYQDTVELTHDSNPAGPSPLTDQEVLQISRLVNYGTLVFYNAPKVTNWQKNARYDLLAAVQGAIWQVASGKDVKHNNGAGALNTLIDDLAGSQYNSFMNASYGFVHSDITLLTPKQPYLYPHRKGSQAFAIAAVPEPATWAMMISGFAMIGVAVRRSRRQLVPVRA